MCLGDASEEPDFKDLNYENVLKLWLHVERMSQIHCAPIALFLQLLGVTPPKEWK